MIQTQSVQIRSAAQRESSLELLRILCMLFIVADHYAGQSGTAVSNSLPLALFYAALGAGSRLGCDLFIVLGAWFLCRQPFRSQRFFSLWLGVWLYTLPLTLLCAALSGESFSLGSLRWAAFPISTQQLWFVSQYLMMLLCAPVLNLLLRKAPRSSLRGLLVMAGVFLVGYTTLFAEDGVFSDALWAFLYLYLLVGYMRRFPCNRLTRMLDTQAAAVLAIVFVVLLALTRGWAQYFGMGGKIIQYLEYYRTALWAAPNIFCALALFLCFRRWHLGTIPFLNRIASATLGVYCIHQTPAVIGVLWTGVFHTQNHVGQPIYAMFVVLTVYAGCTLIDLLRQALVMKPLIDSSWFAALCAHVDDWIAPLDKIGSEQPDGVELPT